MLIHLIYEGENEALLQEEAVDMAKEALDISETEKRAVEEKFDSYVKKTIDNCVRDVTKKETNYQKRITPLDGVTEEELPFLQIDDAVGEDGLTVEIKNMRIKLKGDTLISLLSGLTEREKLALILKEGLGMPYKDIGELLDISPETARKHRQNGINKARERNEREE